MYQDGADWEMLALCRQEMEAGHSKPSLPHLLSLIFFLISIPATSQSDPRAEPQCTWHFFDRTVCASTTSRAPRSSPQSSLSPFCCK